MALVPQRVRPRPTLWLPAFGVLVAAAFAVPALYTITKTVTLDARLGAVVSDSRAPLWRTVQLAALVSGTAAVLGTAMAFLIVRTDLPGRRVARIVAPLPLVFPSFVGAAAFLTALAPRGLFRSMLESVGLSAPDRFRGLGAAWLVLTLFTYPYVYLPVAARLVSSGASVEEAARSLGDSGPQAFRRVIVPQVLPAVRAGALLVFLYTLSDFGAVSLLGYDTLTRVIKESEVFDQPRAFAAATVLIVLAVSVVIIDRWFQMLRNDDGRPNRTVERRTRPMRLGRWRWPAFATIASVLFLALVGPALALGQWAWRGLVRSDDASAKLGSDLGELAHPAWTTAWVSLTTAVVAVLVVLPVAYLAARYRSRVTGAVNAAVVGGFAVPGLVVALALLALTLDVPVLDRVRDTVPLLVAAYVVHFGSQAMRAAELSVAAVPDRHRESARLLGAGAWRRFVSIELPLMRPGLLAGAGLVLLSTVKELPATLLLAPIGFETLATNIWASYENGYLADVGMASIVLLAVSGALTWALVLRRADAL